MKAYMVNPSKIAYTMSDGADTPGKKIPANAASQDYELRFRTMAEHVTLGMFQLSRGPEGRILSTNPVLPRLLGYECPEDLIGKRTRDFVVLADDFEDLTAEIMKDGSLAGREISLKRKDGSAIWVLIQAWKLPSSCDGESVIEGFADDVTEHRVFEQEMHYHESELNRFALALAQANKKLNLLSSITRHDILNKLTGLKGYLELMKGEVTDPTVTEYLTVQEEILETLVVQIQFTKDYQDIGIETPRWFDVKETILTSAAVLPLSSVTVTVETGSLWIYADPLLEKVFYNLIENALRHGGSLTRITFRAEISNDSACILCEDDGCGVPEQFKEAIFLRKHFRNTGFGLFLSRDILGITGLSIHETGEQGHGARFEITVPKGYFRTGNVSS